MVACPAVLMEKESEFDDLVELKINLQAELQVLLYTIGYMLQTSSHIFAHLVQNYKNILEEEERRCGWEPNEPKTSSDRKRKRGSIKVLSLRSLSRLSVLLCLSCWEIVYLCRRYVAKHRRPQSYHQITLALLHRRNQRHRRPRSHRCITPPHFQISLMKVYWELLFCLVE